MARYEYRVVHCNGQQYTGYQGFLSDTCTSAAEARDRLTAAKKDRIATASPRGWRIERRALGKWERV